jgi:hypothetical protein
MKRGLWDSSVKRIPRYSRKNSEGVTLAVSKLSSYWRVEVPNSKVMVRVAKILRRSISDFVLLVYGGTSFGDRHPT